MTGLALTLTTAGRAALVNAQHNGTLPVTVATVGVTAATFPTDSASLKAMTSLPGEIKRVATISGGTTASDTIHVTVNDSSTDTYSVFGVGVYLADGTLFGVYGQPTALLQKSSQATMLLAFDVQFTDIAASSLTFGNTDFQLAQATTTQLGVVQLATDAQAIAGIDPSLVVVPHALQAALDNRLGAGAPTTFAKTLLATSTAALFRTALALKGAALFDPGAGNGLDSDTLDGQHGSFYQAWANLTGVPTAFPPTAHPHTISDVTGLQAALNLLAPLQAPNFTGVATVPTPAVGNNSTQIANTAYVIAAVNNLINGAPGALDTLKELADAMGDDPNFAATITNALAGKVAKAGDTMTGALTVTQTASPYNLTLSNTGGNGAGLKLIGDGATTPSKYIRARAGGLEFINDANTAILMTLTDNGVLTVNQAAVAGNSVPVSINANATGTAYSLISNATTTGYAGWFCQDANAGLFRVGSAGSSYAGASSLNLGTFNSNALGFVTSNTLRMTITAAGNIQTAGNVGIGGAPGATLDVYGAYGRLMVRTSGSSTSIDSVTTANSAYAPLNFTASAYTFGTGNASFSGSVTATGGFQASDRRLKKNIKARAVQRGFALRLARMFCEWDRIADGVHDVGLVAQRVKRLASRYVQSFAHGERGVKRLAIDKAGLALEASMDNALHLHDHEKTIRALVKRIEKLEKAA